MDEIELIKKSEQIKSEVTEFVEKYLKPYEAKNKIFIQEVIKFYNIQTIDDFCKYEHLMPECSAKFVLKIGFINKINFY